METIAVLNQKGGVGKTSTTQSIAAALALKGRKVLLIDLDPQGSLTEVTGAEVQRYSILDVLQRRATAAQAITQGAGCDIIPSVEALAADGILTGRGREYRLREALSKVRGYEWILIDCPPSLGILTINALTAASSCIVPCQANTLSLKALRQLYPTVQIVQQHSNPDLTIRGIVITRYSNRAILSREAVEMISQEAEGMGTHVYGTRIRQGISLQEAQAMRQDVISYSPRSNVAQDYISLADEILKGV